MEMATILGNHPHLQLPPKDAKTLFHGTDAKKNSDEFDCTGIAQWLPERVLEAIDDGFGLLSIASWMVGMSCINNASKTMRLNCFPFADISIAAMKGLAVFRQSQHKTEDNRMRGKPWNKSEIAIEQRPNIMQQGDRSAWPWWTYHCWQLHL